MSDYLWQKKNEGQGEPNFSSDEKPNLDSEQIIGFNKKLGLISDPYMFQPKDQDLILILFAIWNKFKTGTKFRIDTWFGTKIVIRNGLEIDIETRNRYETKVGIKTGGGLRTKTWNYFFARIRKFNWILHPLFPMDSDLFSERNSTEFGYGPTLLQ